MKLYEIKAEEEQAIANLLDSVDGETGEVSQEAIDRLNSIQESKEEKLDSIGAYYKDLIADAKILKEEAECLIERADAKLKRAESLRRYVEGVLAGEKFESKRAVFSWRKSESVVVNDVNLLPEEYTVEKTEVKADKTKIKNAIKSGVDVRGAFLEQRNKLNIK